MLATSDLIQSISFHFSVPTYVSRLISSEQAKRIKEIALAIFSKLSSFFIAFQRRPSEINVKAMAMISFTCMVALLIISGMRGRNTTFFPKPPARRS